MTTVLLVIHFFIAAFLVGVILIQRSEGGALGGLGGGGAGGLMTARGTANLLTRVTGILAAAFFVSSILIAIVLRSPEGGNSVLDLDKKGTAKVELKKEEKPAEGPVVEKAPEAPAPHTEGETQPVAKPDAGAAAAISEPTKTTEPVKGVEPSKDKK